MKPSIDAAIRTTCRLCDQPVTWVRTEGRGLSMPLDPDPAPDLLVAPISYHDLGPDAATKIMGERDWDDSGYDLVFTGGKMRGARGEVQVVRYVAAGTGTHRRHTCPPTR